MTKLYPSQAVGITTQFVHDQPLLNVSHVVIKSLVVFSTVTVRVTILLFTPMLSVYQYSRVYVPGTKIFTEPEEAVEMVPEPSVGSIHTAPESVQAVPNSIVTLLLPESVTTGVYTLQSLPASVIVQKYVLMSVLLRAFSQRQ